MDTIKLRDGRSIVGTIVQREKGKITIRTDSAELSMDEDKIANVTAILGSSQLQEARVHISQGQWLNALKSLGDAEVAGADMSKVGKMRIYCRKALATPGMFSKQKEQNVNRHDRRYTNPVIRDGADPSVIFYNGIYYLYPTCGNFNYSVFTSEDLVHWKKGPIVFDPGEKNVWAPDVFYEPKDGMFYLYYTVNGRIGVAASDQPDGRFVDRETLISNAIDAHLFCDDDGKYYLYYSQRAQIYVQTMSSPTKKKGNPVKLFGPSAQWEATVNEGPWMLKNSGIYHLLYSGNGADSNDYALGYATAESPTGPFSKYIGNPIVKKGNGVIGPGHGCVVKDSAGNLWSVYHQRRNDLARWNRSICIDPLWFDESGILHGKATRQTAEAAPAVTH